MCFLLLICLPVIVIILSNPIYTVFTVSAEEMARLSRNITAECEAAAVDSVDYENESDNRGKSDIIGDKRSSNMQLLDRNSATFLPPNASKRTSVTKRMSNMLKRIVYPSSTSTSSTNLAVEERSDLPVGFGELPVVVTPNTKAKR